MTPKKTLHDWCHYCIQDRRDSEVENCGGHLVHATGRPCPFFEYRLGSKRVPSRVFRQFCMEGMNGSAALVRECETVTCPLHSWRLGKNPNRIGKGSFVRPSVLRPPPAV
jgi:hypothetical protein